MTSDLFHDFLRDFDRQMRHASRHVILLVDNAASHNTGDLQLTNVRLHFLPPNTTAHIQPMDAGIIRAFKAHYRRQLITHYIDCAEKKQPQHVDIRQAIQMTKTAWDTVTPTTIQNCYRHVKILPDAQFEDDDNLPLARLLPDEDEDDDDVPLLELARQMQKLQDPPAMTPEEFLNIDREEATGHFLTDDDILTLVSRDEEVVDIAEEEEDDSEEPPPPKEIPVARSQDIVKDFISFLEQKKPTQGHTERSSALIHHLRTNATPLLAELLALEVKQTAITDFFSV